MGGHVYKSHKKEYFIIFGALTLLTVLELFIPGLKGVSQASKAIALIGLALGKAFLVAYYFMHLKEERGWLKFIATIPISAGCYAIMLILEATYR